MPFQYLDSKSPMVGESHSHVYVQLCDSNNEEICVKLSIEYLNEAHSHTYGFLEHILKRTYCSNGVLQHQHRRGIHHDKKIKPHEVLIFHMPQGLLGHDTLHSDSGVSLCF